MDKNKTNKSDFIKLILILKANIMTILFFVIVSGILSVMVTLNMPNKYRSEVKIVPSDDESSKGLGALAGQFGGLASMAGINLGGKSDVNLLLDTVKSRSFLKPFIKNHNILVELFAGKKWDQASNTLIFDDEVYDHTKNVWIRDVKFPKTSEPSLEEAFEEFNKVFSVHLNKKTNLVTLSITYYSPEIAKKWVDELTIALSEYLRNIDLQKAEESIAFLTQENTSSQIVGIKNVLSEILKEQYQKKMLAKVRKYYGFDIRDDSFLPEEKYSPKRAYIVIGSVFLGGLLSIVFIFLRLFWREIKNA